jgi:hypothetical protein
VQLQYVKGEVAAMEALFPPLPGFDAYRETVSGITSAANDVLFQIVDDVLGQYRDGHPHRWTADKVKDACSGFQEKLQIERNSYVGRNQEILMSALGADSSRQPSYA